MKIKKLSALLVSAALCVGIIAILIDCDCIGGVATTLRAFDTVRNFRESKCAPLEVIGSSFSNFVRQPSAVDVHCNVLADNHILLCCGIDV